MSDTVTFVDPLTTTAPAQGSGTNVLDTSSSDQTGQTYQQVITDQQYAAQEASYADAAAYAALGLQVVNGALVPIPGWSATVPTVYFADLAWFQLYDAADFNAAMAIFLSQNPQLSSTWAASAPAALTAQYSSGPLKPDPANMPAVYAYIQSQKTATTGATPVTLLTVQNPVIFNTTGNDSPVASVSLTDPAALTNTLQMATLNGASPAIVQSSPISNDTPTSGATTVDPTVTQDFNNLFGALTTAGVNALNGASGTAPTVVAQATNNSNTLLLLVLAFLAFKFIK